MNRHALLSFLLFAALASSPAAAQAPPDTDVFLMAFPLHQDEPRVGPVTNLTQRPGFDNQPAFTPEGDLLYTSIRDGQTDVFRVGLTGGAPTPVHTQVTFTPSSEYSPTPLPGGDGFSVVKVEPGGA